MIHRVTYDINDPSYRQEEIIDDGKPGADEGPLLDCMCEIFREHLARQEATKVLSCVEE